MRIRIALGTAAAVVVVPAIFFAVFPSSSAATARATRHEAVAQRGGEKLSLKLMSYAQAQNVAKMVTYANAVELSQEEAYLIQLAHEEAYLKEVTFLRTLAAETHPVVRTAPAVAPVAPVAPVQAAAAPAAAPAPAAVAAPGGSSDATSAATADWACIRQHESNDNYSSGNGGAYQFEFGTWNALTGLPSPAEDYPPAVQDAAALKLYSERGWEPWTTRYVCGL